MKKLSLVLVSVLFALGVFAQSNTTEQKEADASRICLSSYIDPSSMSKPAQKIMKDKLQKIITRGGLGGTKNQRFIITSNVRELNKQTTDGAPVMYIVELEVNFYIGDGIDGTLFASTSMTVGGCDEGEDKAYLDALKKIKVNDPIFKNFIETGKSRIVDYFDKNCDFIITQAQTKAKNQDFDAALAELMQVPNVCETCFNKCMEATKPIFQERINIEGAKFLAEARNVWTAGLDVPAAESASAILSQINPQSTSFAAAEKLSADIAKRVKELDQREWDFQLKQQQDAVDIEKANIKAARDIGVAWGENQQPITYNIKTWW